MKKFYVQMLVFLLLFVLVLTIYFYLYSIGWLGVVNVKPTSPQEFLDKMSVCDRYLSKLLQYESCMDDFVDIGKVKRDVVQVCTKLADEEDYKRCVTKMLLNSRRF